MKLDLDLDQKRELGVSDGQVVRGPAPCFRIYPQVAFSGPKQLVYAHVCREPMRQSRKAYFFPYSANNRALLLLSDFNLNNAKRSIGVRRGRDLDLSLGCKHGHE
jgi:hypothetical protein